jgi:hypothetical protein
LESNAPVICNASATTSELQFDIGGFLSGNSLQVLRSPTLAATGWTTVTNFSIGTNLMVYSASIPPNCPAMFFKVQSP